MKRLWIWIGGVIALGILTHFRWFTGFETLVSGDWRYNHPAAVLHLLAWPSAWRSDYLGGLNLMSAPFYFLLWVHAVLTSLGLTFGQVERLVYLWPIAILTPLGMFLLARRLTKSDLAAFVASCVYAYNVYFLLLQRHHLFIMLADALAPFAVLGYVTLTEKRTLRASLWAGVALFLVSAADARICYFLSGALLVWLAYDLANRRAWKDPRILMRDLALGLLPFVIVAALNAHWILAIGSAGSLARNPLFDREIFGDQLSDMVTAIVLWSGSWTGAVPEAFGTLPAPAYFWTIPLTAFAGLYVARRRPIALYFGLVTLVGVFLSKQSAAPFTAVYEWLFQHAPGFRAFREASKFKVLIALGYSVLTGFLIAWLMEGGAPRRRRAIGWAVSGLLIAMSLWNVKPLLTGEFGSLFIPRHQPPSYEQLSDTLTANPVFSRTLWVPAITEWSAWTPTHPRLSVSALKAPESLLTAASDEELDALGVRYVVIPLDKPDDAWRLGELPIGRDSIVNALDGATHLTRIHRDMEELAVYENVGHRSRFAASAVIDGVVTDVLKEATPFGNGRYRLTVDAAGPFELSFNESFHPDWRLSSEQGWIDLLFRRGDLEGVVHARDAYGLNLFRGVPTTDRPMTFYLYFRPQAYMHLGSAISVVSLLAIILLLIRRTPTKP